LSEVDAVILAGLLRESMRQGSRPSLTITSNSMFPLLRTGDRVELAPVGSGELAPGQIVTILQKQGTAEFSTHRLVGWLNCAESRRILTCGDRNLQFDPPCEQHAVVGRVVSRVRNTKRLSLQEGLGGRLNGELARLAAAEYRRLSGREIAGASLEAPLLEAVQAAALENGRKWAVRRRRQLVRWWSRGLVAVVGWLASREV
jgi:hypothetical protein